MTFAAPLVRLLPLAFLGRLGIAFIEIALAALVISTSVVVGHDLKQWRTWYWDPSTIRPWQPTPVPTNAPSPVPVATLTIGTVPSLVFSQATPLPACHAATVNEQLAFARSGASGVECVWVTQRADGAHVVVASNGFGDRDLGVVAPAQGTAAVHVYAPQSWAEPVLVVTNADTTNVLVFSWQQRGLVELLRAGGDRIDLASDTGGWPKVMVFSRENNAARLRIYRWNGASFALYP